MNRAMKSSMKIVESPLVEGEDYVIDENGNLEFTAAYHLKRGYCCKNGCRNCPYGFNSKSKTCIQYE